MSSRLPIVCLALALAVAPVRARGAAAAAPDPREGGASAADSASRDRLVSLGVVGGIHAGMWVWAYFAWYRDMPTKDFRFGGDGFFGSDTYAGGADKLGHLWTGNMLSRTGTEVLLHGGWKPLPASLIGSGLGFLLLGAVELKDAYYTEFSPGDLAANLTGAALNVLLVNVPAVDDAIDFRVEYLPSPRFLRSVADEGNVDVANDYSGQTYVLAYHLKSIGALGETPWLGWTRYLDVVAGFETRDYLPVPADEDTAPTQHLFLGAALNLQHVLGALGASEGRHDVGHVVFEFLSPPYTVLPAVGLTRAGTRPDHAG